MSLLAPLILVPYKSRKASGTFHISLGNFSVENRFIHGYEAYNTRGTSISLDTSHAILDRMNVQCSDISLFRESINDGNPQGPMIRSDVLDDFHFVVVITRNLSLGHSHLFPDVKVKMSLQDEVKVLLNI